MRSCWLHRTSLLLAANNNSVSHNHSRHLCNVYLPSPNYSTFTTSEPYVWAGWLHRTTLLLATYYNASPHDNARHMCGVPLPSSIDFPLAAS